MSPAPVRWPPTAASTATKVCKKITLVTLVVIAVMLLVVYRSISTTLVMLVTLGIELQVSKGVIAVLANNNLIGLSTFAVNLLVALAIAASTDYVIFWVGRYQEGRSRGLDREAAYYNMFSGTAHVIVGSGLTVAGAMACLSFCRLPYFQTLGVPCSLGLLVVLGGLTDPGPGDRGRGQPLRCARPQTSSPRARVAPHRHRRGALARPGVGRDHRDSPRRIAGITGATPPTTTTATTSPATPRPTSDTTPRIGTSRKPAWSPNCSWSKPTTIYATRPT